VDHPPSCAFHEGISQPGHPLGGKEGLEAGEEDIRGRGRSKYGRGGGGSSGQNDNPAPLGGKWFVALLFKSLVLSAFGVDIHLASSIRDGIMINHATRVVISKTTSIGYGTTILHGVLSLFFFLSPLC
jgi:hypothetical protein